MQNQQNKITVGILFGGKSVEHEISLISAHNIVAAIDRDKYAPLLIGIDKNGRWLISDEEFLQQAAQIKQANRPKLEQVAADNAVVFVPAGRGKLINIFNPSLSYKIDAVFPVLHGTFGEDGAIQGLLKTAEVPFVGASVLGSAIGMDKIVAKSLLRDANIPIAKFIVVTAHTKNELHYDSIVKELGSPFFVKPADSGSSVGVNKVHNATELTAAIGTAFKYTDRVLIEECISGQEIECAVLGNEHPKASLPGEIVTTRGYDFYSYAAKYLDDNGALLKIPANLPPELSEKIMALAVKTFQVLACEGLGRVDFFLKDDGTAVVNEINTIPGFTAISMYPKLWEISGISYKELIDKLLRLALRRFTHEQRLVTSYSD